MRMGKKEKIGRSCKKYTWEMVLNAGLMAQDDSRTGDGFDIQMQANHLSHFLLQLM